jgi:Xaa-Pro aminopeptidase
VHEGPVSISRLAKPVPIAAGMILSNEPGFYLPDHYGVRLENLLLVQPSVIDGATKPFLGFETLTLAPFDSRLLEPSIMTTDELKWLNAYHARVQAMVGPHLSTAERSWLATACEPIG